MRPRYLVNDLDSGVSMELKKIFKKLKFVIPKMPSRNSEMSLYFAIVLNLLPTLTRTQYHVACYECSTCANVVTNKAESCTGISCFTVFLKDGVKRGCVNTSDEDTIQQFLPDMPLVNEWPGNSTEGRKYYSGGYVSNLFSSCQKDFCNDQTLDLVEKSVIIPSLNLSSSVPKPGLYNVVFVLPIHLTFRYVK